MVHRKCRNSEEGLGFVELIISVAIGLVCLLVATQIANWAFQQNAAVSGASNSVVNASAFEQFGRKSFFDVVQSSIWMNTTVATYLGLPWLASQNGAAGSVYYFPNMVFSGTATSTTNDDQLIADPTQKFDLLGLLRVDRSFDLLSITDSGLGDGTYQVGTSDLVILNFSGSPAGYFAGQLIALTTVGGIEFALITSIGGGQISLTWQGLGSFPMGVLTATVPQRYISPGTQIFVPEVRMTGVDIQNRKAVWLAVKQNRGGFNLIMSTHESARRFKVLDAAGNFPSSNILSALHSGFNIEVDFERPSLDTSAALKPHAQSPISTVRVHW